MILAWQITMVTLFIVAAVGTSTCWRLLYDAKRDQEVIQDMENNVVALEALVDRNIRIARTRTYLSGYYLIVVPVFLAVPVVEDNLVVPLWIILFAAFMNYGMIAYSVWATVADRAQRRQIVSSNNNG
jgi:hypothetical protein